MTVAQERALAQTRMRLVAVCTDGRHLIVRGTRLYYLTPGGLLKPVTPR